MKIFKNFAPNGIIIVVALNYTSLTTVDFDISFPCELGICLAISFLLPLSWKKSSTYSVMRLSNYVTGICECSYTSITPPNLP